MVIWHGEGKLDASSAHFPCHSHPSSSSSETATVWCYSFLRPRTVHFQSRRVDARHASVWCLVSVLADRDNSVKTNHGSPILYAARIVSEGNGQKTGQKRQGRYYELNHQQWANFDLAIKRCVVVLIFDARFLLGQLAQYKCSIWYGDMIHAFLIIFKVTLQQLGPRRNVDPTLCQPSDHRIANNNTPSAAHSAPFLRHDDDDHGTGWSSWRWCECVERLFCQVPYDIWQKPNFVSVILAEHKRRLAAFL